MADMTSFSKTMRAIRSCPKMATNLNICTHGNIPPSHQTVQGCDTHTATLCSPQQIPFAAENSGRNTKAKQNSVGFLALSLPRS